MKSQQGDAVYNSTLSAKGLTEIGLMSLNKYQTDSTTQKDYATY